MAPTEWDGATFEAHRPLLFSIAYRIDGAEAEDVVGRGSGRQDEHAGPPRAYSRPLCGCASTVRRANGTLRYPFGLRAVGRTESGIVSWRSDGIPACWGSWRRPSARGHLLRSQDRQEDRGEWRSPRAPGCASRPRFTYRVAVEEIGSARHGQHRELMACWHADATLRRRWQRQGTAAPAQPRGSSPSS